MFDLEMCQEVSPTRAWTLTSQLMLYIVNHPLLAIALITAIACLPIIFAPSQQKSKWRKRSLIGGSTLLFLYILSIAPAIPSLSNYFLTRNLPANSTQSADAIVVLGRGDKQNNIRASVTADLWREQRAPLLFASGRKDTPQIIERWQQATPPIRASAIGGEPCSLTTEQNAQFTAALLWPQGVRKIILVTDQPHMRRSQLIFERFGFTVIPHVIPFETNNPARKNFLSIREIIGLVSYGLQGRYEPEDIPPVSIISE